MRHYTSEAGNAAFAQAIGRIVTAKKEAENQLAQAETSRLQAEERHRKQEEEERERIAKKEQLKKDPAVGFKAFSESFLDTYRKQIAGEPWNMVSDVRYDVKKTDSLVSPVMGVLNFKVASLKGSRLGMWREFVLEFAPDNGQWRLGDVTATYHADGLADTWYDLRKDDLKAVGQFGAVSKTANESLLTGQ